MIKLLVSTIADVPEWCSFFSKREYVEFEFALGDFCKLHPDLSVETSRAGFITNTQTGEEFGLMNVAQLCKQQDNLKVYKNIIVEHFRGMQEIKEVNEDKGILMSRVQPIEHIEPTPDATYREILPGLIELLVLDFPTATKTFINRNKQNEEQLFSDGRVNASKAAQFEIGSMSDDMSSIQYVITEEFLSSNIFLELERFDLMGKDGVLIGFPHRQLTYLCPLPVSSDIVSIVNNMCFLTHKAFIDGPGSISPHVYFVTPDSSTVIEVQAGDNGRMTIQPSAEFVEYLNLVVSQD